jgi:hypothetical protein
MDDDESIKTIDSIDSKEEEHNFLLSYLVDLNKKNLQSKIEEENCYLLFELNKNQIEEIRIKEIEISKEVDDYIMEIQSLKQINFIKTRFLETKFKNYFEIIMNKIEDEFGRNLAISENLLPQRLRDIERVQYLLEVIFLYLILKKLNDKLN